MSKPPLSVSDGDRTQAVQEYSTCLSQNNNALSASNSITVETYVISMYITVAINEWGAR